VPDDVMSRPAEPPDAVLRYAPHADGVVDLYLPPVLDEPVPLVVYVHGGFWRTAFDRTHARPLADALVARGTAVALVEYRRGPDAWPETSTDLAAALHALPGLLAGAGVPTTTTTLVGHSAGGHLVLWLANEPLPTGLRVRRVVALAPVGDLRAAVALDMGGGAARDFLGGSPEELPEVYTAADPGTRLADRPRLEVVVLHGDRDDAVPVSSSRGLAERYPWLDYRELPGRDHFDVIDPLSPAWRDVRDAIAGR